MLTLLCFLSFDIWYFWYLRAPIQHIINQVKVIGVKLIRVTIITIIRKRRMPKMFMIFYHQFDTRKRCWGFVLFYCMVLLIIFILKKILKFIDYNCIVYWIFLIFIWFLLICIQIIQTPLFECLIKICKSKFVFSEILDSSQIHETSICNHG